MILRLLKRRILLTGEVHTRLVETTS